MKCELMLTYDIIHIEHTFCISPFLVTFFSATIDGRNLIFGHKLHIGTPYCGKCFWTQQIAINSCWEKCDEKYLGTDGRTEVKQYTPPPVEWGYKNTTLNIKKMNNMDPIKNQGSIYMLFTIYIYFQRLVLLTWKTLDTCTYLLMFFFLDMSYSMKYRYDCSPKECTCKRPS
jgi:hypothetical protein